MAEIEEVIARNRARVLGRTEGPMVRELLIDYSRVRALIEREAAALAAAIEAQGTPTVAQMLREIRLGTLLNQVENEMRTLTGREAVRVQRAVGVAIEAGTSDAVAMAASLAASESALTVPAAERIVGSLQRGSALRALVDEIPGAARAAVRNALIDGIVRGLNPRITARAVGSALGGQTARALTIARTETMRAYRGGVLETYRANPDVVGGWVWISGRDRRTCAMCWAMHGTRHDLGTLMATHPNCRCSQGPLPRGANPPIIEPGPEQFASLPIAEQRRILGPAKFEAYRDGALELPDLVGTRRDPRWGQVRWERPLSRVVGPERAVAYRRGTILPAAPARAATRPRTVPVPAAPPPNPRAALEAAERAYDEAVARGVTAQRAFDEARMVRIRNPAAPYDAKRIDDARAEARAAVTALGEAKRQYAAAAREVVPDVYRPAASIAAARAEGKRLGVSAEYVANGRDSLVEPNLQRLKGYGSGAAERPMLQGMNEVNAEINRLQRQWPAARETRLDVMVFQRGGGRAHVMHAPGDPGMRQTMRLYPAEKDQSGPLTEFVRREGYMHGSTGTHDDVFRHEFAHAITYRNGDAAGNAIIRDFGATVNANLKGTSISARTVLGKYGASKSVEGIAEVVSIYTHPAYGSLAGPAYYSTGLPGGRLPGWLEQWVVKFLNGETP